MPDESTDRERMIELESVVAHLQHELEQLNAVILRQQEEIESLRRQLSKVEARVEDAGTEDRDLDDERPPHW